MTTLARIAGAAEALRRTIAVTTERLRLGLEHRHAIALRVERIAPHLEGVPRHLIAAQLEELEPYAPTDEQAVLAIAAWARTGIPAWQYLGLIYSGECP